ncbi:MAG TPA: hypothetical protein VNZ86_06965 [Bacteroidia bacterium]|jgi:hypothetical protein|nr:hypothetical protein [Bacteroidia bacterium]
MTSRKYYYTLFFVSLPLLVYTLFSTWLLIQNGTQLFDPGLIFNIFVIYILWKENKMASLPVWVINSFFVLIMLSGFIFKVQHWPFNTVLLYAMPGPALTLIAYQIIQKNRNRLLHLLILSFPLFHVVFLNLRLSHLPGQTQLWMLDMLSLTALAGFSGFYLLHKS